MKRCLLFLLLLSSAWAWGQSCPAGTPTTAHLGLYVPTLSSTNWGYCVNANSAFLDNFLSGVSAIPALNVSGTTTLNNLVVNGTCTGTGCAVGITNSAGANVMGKSDGANIVGSNTTDDGTTTTINGSGGLVVGQ